MLCRDFPINTVLSALLIVMMLIGRTLGLIDGILLAITVVVYVPCLIKKGMGRIVGGLSVIAYIGYTVYLLLTTI